jgi:hypothetical protein
MREVCVFRWRPEASVLHVVKVMVNTEYISLIFTGLLTLSNTDNHMINGTKLLNVAGMTRGRRDGILKSEKVRHVVKIGPMHLKGVW